MTEQRHEMVRAQIQARGIHDPRVLEAMREVKRHLFVPTESSDDAYEDFPLPIGEGQTILRPESDAANYVKLPHGNVFLQFEGLNPSGSFKDNGMSAAFTHARMVGAQWNADNVVTI